MSIVFWAWEKDNFQGKSISEYANRAIKDVTDLGFPNDQISSFRIAADTHVYFYKDTNFRGTVWHYYGPMTREKATDFPDNEISSFQVYPLGLSDVEKLGCYTGNDSELNKRCGSWAAGTGQNEVFMRNYCSLTASALNGNIATTPCQKWCMEHPGECDQSMNLFCAANPGNALCTCIASRANGIVPNPLCVDRACINSGYVTQNMRNTACPAVVDCTVHASLLNSGVSLAQGVQVNQNCGNSQGNTGGGGGGTTVVDTPAEPADDPDVVMLGSTPVPKKTLTMAMILLVIIIVVVALAAILGTTGRDKIPENRVR